MPATTSLDAEQLAALRGSFAGGLLLPGTEGYDDARRIHNGLIDKHPALIASCRGTVDIVEALAFARKNHLEVSIRGGGHNVSGRAVCNGGLMIDLSLMKGIHVDPDGRTARAQGGVTWREFNRETHLHGLATTGGVISTTGIAGLTLGGGLGWLMAAYGLAADNLLSIELVTAAGEVVEPSEDHLPDLFWALRGGGGNFGVAASFKYRLHPLSMVVGGLVAYPLPAARDFLRFFRDFTASASDDLTVNAVLAHAPDGSGLPIVAALVCHTGVQAQAERELRPLLEFGSPLMVQVGPIPYPVLNTLLDAGFPKGALNYWKSSFIQELSDDLIEVILAAFEGCPSLMSSILLEHFHGAVTRVPITATPVPHRQVGYNLLIASVWQEPSSNETNIAWTRATYSALASHLETRRWLNYLGDDETEAAVRDAYGANYSRLAEVKNKYDPDNIFRLNQNVRPTRA
jgi:FAD/FMN-containing dehydrogenase